MAEEPNKLSGTKRKSAGDKLNEKKFTKIDGNINSEIYRRLFLKYPDLTIFKHPTPISSIENYKKKPIIDFVDHFSSLYYSLKSGFDIEYDEVIDKRNYIVNQITEVKKDISDELLDSIAGTDNTGAKKIIRRGFELINKKPMTLIIQLPFVLAIEIKSLIQQKDPGLLWRKTFLNSNEQLNLTEDEFLDEIAYLFFYGVAFFRYITFLKEKLKELKEGVISDTRFGEWTALTYILCMYFEKGCTPLSDIQILSISPSNISKVAIKKKFYKMNGTYHPVKNNVNSKASYINAYRQLLPHFKNSDAKAYNAVNDSLTELTQDYPG